MKKIKLQIKNEDGSNGASITCDDTTKNRSKIQLRIESMKKGQTYSINDVTI